MFETEKTSNFLKAIEKYAKDQRREIKSKAKAFKQKELQKAEAEVLRDAYFLIQKEMAQMRKSIDSEVSKVEIESRRTLLEKRAKIAKEVFERAREKLIAFTNTDGYLDSIKKSVKLIKKTAGENGVTLYVKREDMKFADKIREFFAGDCDVKESQEIKLGGIFGYSACMGIIIDESLDSKLDKQRDWFTENSGLNVV